MTNKQMAINLMGISREDYIESATDLSNKIKRQFAYDRHVESIEKLLEKTSIATEQIEALFSKSNIQIINNCGLEERSRFCYTLYIDGECIFTSGTIKKVIERIIQKL